MPNTSQPTIERTDSISSAVNQKTVTLSLKTFWCQKTTDDTFQGGEDEVYLIISSKKSDGSTTKNRIPGNKDGFSLDDKGGPKKQSLEVRYGHIPNLWNGTLKDGEIVDISIVTMESDNSDGGYSEAFDVADEIAKSMEPENDFLKSLAAIGKFLSRLNKDDFTGDCAVRIKNENGSISSSWIAKEKCIDRGGSNNEKVYHFVGDGAVYFATFSIS